MTHSNEIRVRFAPSPTGLLHVGNARTALFNWLFARHHHGKLILRIEDTDQERTAQAFTDSLIDELTWMGIDWDEGPIVGGNYGPYHQIERLELYQKHLQTLISRNLVYPCYCTEEELEKEREMLIATHQTPRYGGKCLHLSDAQKSALTAQGRRHAWRFRVESGEIKFCDLIRGEINFNAKSIGDFIVVRSSGVPAYNFAVVVDDALMRISHVIRGEDHLSNTALQLLLYNELGFDAPQFAHHSLILGKDRAKLSKRHGAVAIGEFRRLGFLPDALTNYLAICGATLGDGIEICERENIIKLFSLNKMGKSGAVFDEDKLRWMNSHYIRYLSDETLSKMIKPMVQEIFGETKNGVWILSFCRAFKDNFTLINDAKEYLEIFNDENFIINEQAREAVGNSESQILLGHM
ncbi:MAG: glutamate--tRNA ligase, partial [Deltaproteobacteria bacterium]